MSSSPGNVDSLLAALSVEARSVPGAPTELRDSVRAIPDGGGSGRHFDARGLLLQVGSLGAGIAALAGVAVLIASGGGFAAGGRPPGGGAAVFDPSVDGPGILASPPADQLSMVPWVVAAGAAVIVALIAWRRSRTAKVAAAIVIAGLLAVANVVATQPGLGFGYAWGQRTGLMEGDLARPGRSEFYVTSEAGENFLFFFNVANHGTLPVRVLGVIEEPHLSGMAPRWTAIGMRFDELQSGAVLGFESARPFEPIELRPGETLDIYVAGRAGVCAFGPDYEPPTGSFLGRSDVRFAFSVLGLQSETRVALPFTVSQPVDEECSQQLTDEEDD